LIWLYRNDGYSILCIDDAETRPPAEDRLGEGPTTLDKVDVGDTLSSDDRKDSLFATWPIVGEGPGAGLCLADIVGVAVDEEYRRCGSPAPSEREDPPASINPTVGVRHPEAGVDEEACIGWGIGCNPVYGCPLGG